VRGTVLWSTVWTIASAIQPMGAKETAKSSYVSKITDWLDEDCDLKSRLSRYLEYAAGSEHKDAVHEL
jgi:hypothetical protein